MMFVSIAAEDHLGLGRTFGRLNGRTCLYGLTADALFTNLKYVGSLLQMDDVVTRRQGLFLRNEDGIGAVT